MKHQKVFFYFHLICFNCLNLLNMDTPLLLYTIILEFFFWDCYNTQDHQLWLVSYKLAWEFSDYYLELDYLWQFLKIKLSLSFVLMNWKSKEIDKGYRYNKGMIYMHNTNLLWSQNDYQNFSLFVVSSLFKWPFKIIWKLMFWSYKHYIYFQWSEYIIAIN